MKFQDDEVEDELPEEREEGSGTTWPDDELGIFDDDDPAQRRRDPLRRAARFDAYAES
jgi:hypothetical protein